MVEHGVVSQVARDARASSLKAHERIDNITAQVAELAKAIAITTNTLANHQEFCSEKYKRLLDEVEDLHGSVRSFRRWQIGLIISVVMGSGGIITSIGVITSIIVSN